MSVRTRSFLLLGALALLSTAVLVFVPMWRFRGAVEDRANLRSAAPVLPIDRRIDPSDVTAHEGAAAATTIIAPSRTGAKDTRNANSRRDTSAPAAGEAPRYDREPATETLAPANGLHIVLASITEPEMRMSIAPPENSRIATGLPAAKSSAQVAVAPAAPAPTATPSFCPAGATMQQGTGTFGREKWCERPDRGGIDIKDGPFQAWWANGKKRATGEFAEGKQNGEWTEWYETGLPAAHGEYRNGRRDGAWTFYRETGKKAEEGSFRNGEKQGRWIVFDDAGRRAAEGEIRTNARLSRENGKWTFFRPDGTRKEEGTFHEGRRDGRWTEWDLRGHVVAVNDYLDGEKE